MPCQLAKVKKSQHVMIAVMTSTVHDIFGRLLLAVPLDRRRHTASSKSDPEQINLGVQLLVMLTSSAPCF